MESLGFATALGFTRGGRLLSRCNLESLDDDAVISREIQLHVLRGLAEEAFSGARGGMEEVSNVFGGVMRRPRRKEKRRRAEEFAQDDSDFVKLGYPSLRVHYRMNRGDEEGRRLRDGLMLHGHLGSTFSYRKIQPRVASLTGGRILSMDLPGFGLTERPNMFAWNLLRKNFSPYSFDHSCDLAAEMIDKMQLRNTVLFGHSLGGYLALQAALRGANVGALVLFSPAVIIPRAPSFVKAFLKAPVLGKMTIRNTMENAVEGDRVLSMIRKNFHDLSRIELAETIEGYTLPLSVHDWDDGLHQYYISFDGFNMLQDTRLRRLNIPVLIIAGENDQVLSVGSMEALSTKIPNSTLHVLPACGHIPHEELPDETMYLIENWLARIPQR